MIIYRNDYKQETWYCFEWRASWGTHYISLYRVTGREEEHRKSLKDLRDELKCIAAEY